MTYFLIWALIGVACAAWDHHRSGDDFTLGMGLIKHYNINHRNRRLT